MIINGGKIIGGRFQDQSVGFTITSADFVNVSWGSDMSINSNLGFTTNGNFGPGYEFYGPRLGSNNSGSDSKLAEVKAYFDAKGLNHNSNAYMFNVTFGAGSTQSSGVAIVELFYNNANDGQLDFGIVDTSNPIWQTDNIDYYNGSLKSLAGTWNFPVTFSVITPLIVNGNNWC